MSTKSPVKFGHQEHTQFMEEGYVRLGHLLSKKEIAALQQRIDDIMLGVIPYDNMRFQLDSTTGVYREAPPEKYRTQGRDTPIPGRLWTLNRIPCSSPTCNIHSYVTSHGVISVKTFRSTRAMFMNKPANQGTVLPWHQDVGVGWGLDRNPIITVWMALDDAT